MNEVIKTIQNLKSIRNFSEKKISDEDLKLILNSAVRAANASSMQSYSMIVIENKNIMKELTGYSGSKAVIYCIDLYRLLTTAKFLKQPFGIYDIISFITSAIDTILAVQTSVIAAKSIGIDSLITNGINRMGLKKAYKLLNLPEKGCFPLITVIFGYNKEEQKKQHGRLQNDAIIHYGKYNQLNEEKIKNLIAEYNNHKKPIGLINDWEKLGLKNYLDWLFSKWLKSENLSIAEEKLKEFYNILNKTGFLKYSNFKL